ncbi:hypothetical protein [Thalassospira lucentensis]|uniref:hypothetical protein n=1 Tax=Thalassospira lucentensis TaxID=168935 RepID=UPI002942FF7B|nr:hypothetical protein [Thalassospira lucentensis]WOI12272.1 hypothetical protein R1T41_06710 [Thalassospira lucentensis]
MNASDVTLYASIIAASVAILNLIISAVVKRGEEARAVVRQAVASDLNEVGRLIHETIALSVTQFKAKSDDAYKERSEKAREAASRLKEKRLNVRYSLWGLDSAFRDLSRLPDWSAHAKLEEEARDAILTNGSKLGDSLDRVVRKVYVDGRQASCVDVFRVERSRKRLRKSYEKFQQSDL